MPDVIYERTFYPYSGRGEAHAVIVDYSDPGHVELRFGITERAQSCGGRDVVTFQNKFEEDCSHVPSAVRQALWRDLYQQAKNELNWEIRIATDPHYDLPEREVY
jgi:hypothetical protein